MKKENLPIARNLNDVIEDLREHIHKVRVHGILNESKPYGGNICNRTLRINWNGVDSANAIPLWDAFINWPELKELYLLRAEKKLELLEKQFDEL